MIQNQNKFGNSCHGAAEMNPTRNHEIGGLIPGLAHCVKDLALAQASDYTCCGVGQ